MTYPPADDVPDDICHLRVDDMHVMPGVVLHEIRQLRQEEGSHHLEQLCIKPTGLLVYIFKCNIYICLTSLTHAKCGTRSTLCWKVGNISGSTELFAL